MVPHPLSFNRAALSPSSPLTLLSRAGLFARPSVISVNKPVSADTTCGLVVPESFCANSQCSPPSICNSSCPHPPLPAPLLALESPSITNTGVQLSRVADVTSGVFDGSSSLSLPVPGGSTQGYAVTLTVTLSSSAPKTTMTYVRVCI